MIACMHDYRNEMYDSSCDFTWGSSDLRWVVRFRSADAKNRVHATLFRVERGVHTSAWILLQSLLLRDWR